MSGGKDDITGYVYGTLMPTILSRTAPSVINMLDQFSGYLVTKRGSALTARENAERWFPGVRSEVIKELGTWDKRGIPRPASIMEDDRTLVTWRHRNYEGLSGYVSLGDNFFEILEWIRGLNSREFLIPNVIFLAHLGAERIFVTEGKGDEGVDVIGTIESGPLKSTGVFVQAKTSSRASGVGRDTVLLEYAKYVSLPHTDKFRQYMRALEIEATLDGSASIYAITANNRFSPGARNVAARLGILLRSDLQVARYVHCRYGSMTAVREVECRMKPHLDRDLVTNVFRFL